MNEDRLSIGGAVVFWRLAKSTNRQHVCDGLERFGLKDYAPEPRTKLACLRAALPDVYTPTEKGVKYNVRPVKNGKTKGFAVVAERKDDVHAGDEWGTVVATAKLDKEDGGVAVDPWDIDKYHAIRDGMAGAADWLTSASVASSLVKLVEEHCDGVALRRNGGVYWVRQDRLDEWTQIADIFETASAKADKKGEPAVPNCIYGLKVVGDEQMVRAVGDSLTDDILDELTRIEADISKADVTEYACLTRLKNVGTLEAKVARYEQAFSKPLDILQDALKRSSTAVAQATLLASAAQQKARVGA